MSTIETVRVGRGIRVLEDRVLIRRDRPVDRSKGGIILPDQSKEIPDEGEVIFVGPGKAQPVTNYVPGQGGDSFFRLPMSVAVGDKVAFLRYSGTTIRHEGEDLVVLRETDIVAVLEKSAPVITDDEYEDEDEDDEDEDDEDDEDGRVDGGDGAPSADGSPPPVVPMVKIWPVDPDGVVSNFGLLGEDVSFRAADDEAPGYTSIAVGRLIAPYAVLTAFLGRYGDLTRIGGNRLRVQVGDEPPCDYERALVGAIRVPVASDGMSVTEQVQILAREQAA
jgi:chaperonin GroES